MSYQISDFAYQLGFIKSNPAQNPQYTSRKELLDSIIVEFYVFIEPITERIKNKDIKHASIIVKTNNNQYVKIEYGAYDKNREGDYVSKVHYFTGDNGLRFVQISDSSFKDIKSDESNIVVKCDFLNKDMNIFSLISRTGTCDGIYEWSKYNYNLFGQNCQFFVIKAIKVIKALLPRSYLDLYQIEDLPKIIIRQLVFNSAEEDEEDYIGLKYVGPNFMDILMSDDDDIEKNIQSPNFMDILIGEDEKKKKTSVGSSEIENNDNVNDMKKQQPDFMDILLADDSNEIEKEFQSPNFMAILIDEDENKADIERMRQDIIRKHKK